jgi:hypothetical protein
MGREAVCRCTIAGEEGEAKLHIDGPDLFVRGVALGGPRRRIPLAEMTGVSVRAGRVTFTVGGEKIALHLGEELAPRWAKALLTPPPTLAKKLGITDATHVLLLGPAAEPELESALAQAKSVAAAPRRGDLRADASFDLVIACVRKPGELVRAAELFAGGVPQSVPVWIVYPKGAGQPVCESDVRSTLLAIGFVDTKVASVSGTHTGLKFTRRKMER